MRRLPFTDGWADGCFVCASLLHVPRHQAPRALSEFRRVLCGGGALYIGVKEGDGEAWVTDQAGKERFFVYYHAEEVDQLIQAAGFKIADAWLSPPGEGQRHNWINRFAIARP